MRSTKYHIRRGRNCGKGTSVVKSENVDIQLEDRDSYRVIIVNW